MSNLIRAIRFTPMPRSTSNDVPAGNFNAYSRIEAQAEAHQRQAERHAARIARAARAPVPAQSIQPIRLPSYNNFIINMPIN